jgi:threonine dehydrogenase-like Zn-dependent dehydrogenase
MRGVVYSGIPLQVTVQDLPRPSILETTDAIIRITTSAICGTDLHIYRGFFGGTPPWVVGHEAVGFITEIGDDVSGLTVGDYVVVSSSHSEYSFGGVAISPDYYGFGGATDGLQGLTQVIDSCPATTNDASRVCPNSIRRHEPDPHSNHPCNNQRHH